MSILNAVANFNPRSPHRERRDYRVKSTVLPLFQSTLPSQGATAGQETPKADIEISIHAPLTGSDHNRKFTIIGKCNFNPRSPHRERQVQSLFTAANWDISIHAPLTGSDSYHRKSSFQLCISIHAPLTGSDVDKIDDLLHYVQFQSTLPSQGATSKVADCIVYTMISIHAPLTGSDSYFAILIIFYTISIHAPLTGSDVQWRRDKPDKFYFNPRSPHRERLINEWNSIVDQ